MRAMIVGVHPLAGFDKLLHYRVPENLRASVAVGSLVRVPVVNALRLGIVGEIGAPKDFPVERLKSVAQVVLSVSRAAARSARARPLDGALLCVRPGQHHRDDDSRGGAQRAPG